MYSNVPAVLSEVVANAWDADAENASINIDAAADTIIVEDDGHGMDEQDINAKYLTVGYKRRKVSGEETTPRFHRPVMGRKGIGKLSLFSIASTVEVHTTKGGKSFGFRMDADGIRTAIEQQQRARLQSVMPDEYHPEELPPERIQVQRGTRIILTRLKKGVSQAPAALRKRLARRFSVLGGEHQFSVDIGGKPITIEDRDYFHKIQYFWTIGDVGSKYDTPCRNVVRRYPRPGSLAGGDKITGWIGTVEKSGTLKEEGESINKIVVMMRGKLAQEDILEEIGETGLYAKYLIGEIHADFLDADDQQDMATSSRQKLIESDPRYTEMKEFIRSQLKEIQSVWTSFREKEGEEEALEIPAVQEWYRDLPNQYKPSVRRLFAKISGLPIEDKHDRRIIIKNSVLAFESLRYKHNLQRIEQLQPQDIQALASVFADLDDIETTLYGQIVQQRMQIISALLEKVDENAREKVIQQHIFEHLWLIDASWEKTATSEIMEKRIGAEFAQIDAGLTDYERASRVDIKYRTVVGKHVLVELKRPDRVIDTMALMEQITKYWAALRKILESIGQPDDQVEIVCVVGRDLRDWDGPGGRKASETSLRAYDARVVKYDQLVFRAEQAYKEYLEKRAQVGRLSRIISDIEEWEPEPKELQNPASKS